ncbi:MAG: threonyl-tRNA synthetase editing domain-containing protein [Myxococcota bacterium]
MRLLTFLVDSFRWTPFSRTLETAPDAAGGAVEQAVVVFFHIEEADVGEGRSSVFRKTLKHIKWLANKRELKTIVLHSFAHLGGSSAEPEAARAFIEELRERLEATGYAVEVTPFGWFHQWSIDVRGESLAKVFKAF